MSQFLELGLAAPLARAVEAKGYLAPTPIQIQAIPKILAGGDLLGIAATGTGKTAAFALPILHRLGAQGGRARSGACRALILCPTRELASQIAESFRAYGAGTGLGVEAVFGGVSFEKQAQRLRRGVDIVVATPGRLLDHLERRVVRLDEAEILVLDEADHMLDLGFIPAVRRIVKALPRKRQTLLFSATMPPPIKTLASEILAEFETVSVAAPGTPAERIDQRVIHVEGGAKRAELARLLAAHADKRSLVFTRTKRGADRVVKDLAAAGIAAEAIHGNKSQGQRERALDAFKTERTLILVATDIAARGIDIGGINLVVNFDLPEVPETYVHRIGRTARAGASGLAVSFCAPDDRGLLKAIERLIGRPVPATAAAKGAASPAPQAPRSEKAAQRPRHAQRPAHADGRKRTDGRNHADGGQRQALAYGGTHFRSHAQDRKQAGAQPRPDGRRHQKGGEGPLMRDLPFMSDRRRAPEPA